MSQDTFPFGDAEDDESFADAPSRRRALLIGGGAVAALVVVAGGWFLLGGSGGSADPAAALVPSGSHLHVAGSHASLATTTTLPAAYTGRLGRDPFKALYIVPAAAAPAGAGSTATTLVPVGTGTSGTVGSTPTGSGSTGTTSTGTTSTGTAPTGTSTASSPPTSSRYILKLVSISKPSPQARFSTWLVDGKSATVLPAQRFGKFGELVVLAFTQNSAGAVTGAVIQVGDDSPLDVAVGDSVSVL